MNAPTSTINTQLLQKAELQAQVVRGLEAHLPSSSLLWNREDTTPYECDGLTAYRQRPLVVALPETEAGGRHSQDLPPVGRAGGGARCGHRPVGRCHAACFWRHAVAGPLQQNPEDGQAQPHGRGAVRCAQPGHQRGRVPAGPVLRARPQQPDRLHHWRQRGRKLGRRALPEIWPHAAQRAQGQGLHHRGRPHHLWQRRAGHTPATTC